MRVSTYVQDNVIFPQLQARLDWNVEIYIYKSGNTLATIMTNLYSLIFN